MISRVRLADGRVASLRTTEVVTTDGQGQPVAVTYEENGLIMHCDATKADFPKICRRLGFRPPKIEIIEP